MSNEDKILSMLEQMDNRLDRMDSRLNQMDNRLDRMDSRLNRMDGRLEKLETGQAEIINEVKAIREQTEHLTEFEAKTDLNFKKISNDINTLKNITKDNLYDIAELKIKAV